MPANPARSQNRKRTCCRSRATGCSRPGVQENLNCESGRSRTGRAAGRRSRPQTMRSEISNGTSPVWNNGRGQDSATRLGSVLRNTPCSYVYRQPFVLPAVRNKLRTPVLISAFHRLEKNIFQRVAAEVEPPDAHLVFRSHAVDVARLDSIRQNHLHAVGADRTLAAQPLDRLAEIAIRPIGLQFEESRVRAAFFVQIGVVCDASL